MDREHKGVLYGVLGALTNSVMVIFIKLAHDVPNEAIVFFRFLIGFFLLFGFYVRGHISLSRLHLSQHFFRSLTGLLAIYFYYFAVKWLPLANALSLSSTMPLFTPFVILIWLRMIVSRWRFIAAGVGFLGVLLMLNPSAFHWEWASFAALGTGLCSSIAFVGVRQLSKVQTAGIILFYYFGAATIISFFPCMYTWEPLEHKILWFYLVCIGVLGLLFQYFMTLSFSLAPVSKAGLTTYLGVLFGGLFGWWIWDEVPSLWSAAGIILTIGGGVLAVLDKRAPRKL